MASVSKGASNRNLLRDYLLARVVLVTHHITPNFCRTDNASKQIVVGSNFAIFVAASELCDEYCKQELSSTDRCKCCSLVRLEAYKHFLLYLTLCIFSNTVLRIYSRGKGGAFHSTAVMHLLLNLFRGLLSCITLILHE